MLDSVKKLFSKEGASGFEKVRDKVKDLAKRLSRGEEKRDNTEILGVLEEYGAQVAPYRMVSSKRELKEATEEFGCPVMVKPITTRVITRSEAGAVIRVDSLNDTDKAYAQVIGRIVSSTPWVGVTGVMVQQFVDGNEKLSVSWQREKKKPFPFKWVKRFLEGKEEKRETASNDELLAQLEELSPTLQQVVSACHFAWVENPELSSMEVDIVLCKDLCKVVDARISVFG